MKLSYGFQLEKVQQKVSDKIKKTVTEESKRGWEKEKMPRRSMHDLCPFFFFGRLAASCCRHLCASYVSVSVWKTSAWLRSLNPRGSMKHGHMIWVGQWWWWASVVGVCGEGNASLIFSNSNQGGPQWSTGMIPYPLQSGRPPLRPRFKWLMELPSHLLPWQRVTW